MSDYFCQSLEQLSSSNCRCLNLSAKCSWWVERIYLVLCQSPTVYLHWHMCRCYTFRQLKASKKSAFVHLMHMDEKTMVEEDWNMQLGIPKSFPDQEVTRQKDFRNIGLLKAWFVFKEDSVVILQRKEYERLLIESFCWSFSTAENLTMMIKRTIWRQNHQISSLYSEVDIWTCLL